MDITKLINQLRDEMNTGLQAVAGQLSGIEDEIQALREPAAPAAPAPELATDNFHGLLSQLRKADHLMLPAASVLEEQQAFVRAVIREGDGRVFAAQAEALLLAAAKVAGLFDRGDREDIEQVRRIVEVIAEGRPDAVLIRQRVARRMREVPEHQPYLYLLADRSRSLHMSAALVGWHLSEYVRQLDAQGVH